MEYKVVVTADAEEDLNRYIRYLVMVEKSEQAAKNLLDDFETIGGTGAHYESKRSL